MSKMLYSNLLLALALAATGCKSLLPIDDRRTTASWTNFATAQAEFEKILPHTTTLDELRCMGFDPDHTPNIRWLTYLDVMQRFMPNPSITKNDLDPNVREVIECRDACQAFEIDLEIVNNHRYGNLPLDVLGFKKKNKITGWSFRGLVLLKDNVVTYKLLSGEPNMNKLEKRTKPLGPFQELDGIVGRVPGKMF
jgi:hypothetical protein